MQRLAQVGPAFVEMAHGIVWCSVASVDTANRPRSRILHPVWTWKGSSLVGWVGTTPTPLKQAHLDHSPDVSCSYWSPDHDTCTAECRASLHTDDETCLRAWEILKSGPEPAGYEPAIVPIWSNGPPGENFCALRLDPWRLRVFPGAVLLDQGGDVLEWSAAGA